MFIVFMLLLSVYKHTQSHKWHDNVAEWLRRGIANPVLFEREGSNPSVVDMNIFAQPLGCRAFTGSRVLMTTWPSG